jgi:predicted RNA-binding protein with PUA-like domain
MKSEPELKDMEMLRQGRLSVSPVRPEEWTTILKMAGEG